MVVLQYGWGEFNHTSSQKNDGKKIMSTSLIFYLTLIVQIEREGKLLVDGEIVKVWQHSSVCSQNLATSSYF